MDKLIAALTAAVVLGSGCRAGAQPAVQPTAPVAWQTPSAADIRSILVDRIDVRHQGVGIVVGVIDRHGRRIIAYGVSDQRGGRRLDGRTVFEIGSLTKVFTSLLLSEMVQANELSLTDPASKYLPSSVTLPRRGGREIELIDLATHTSGLPGMPADFYPIKNQGNPYADYTVDEMYRFLSQYELSRDVGEKYEYSNLGGALLGQVVARRAGVNYESLVQERITGPLEMHDTSIALSPSMKARLAIGHDEHMAPTPNWDLPAFEGAGALRSTANDMLTFLGAELGYVHTPLAPAMAAQIAPRRPTGKKDWSAALGWAVKETSRQVVFWHDGGTGGYMTSMGFDPKAGVGVVLLSNSITPGGGDDISWHILTGAPLDDPTVAH